MEAQKEMSKTCKAIFFDLGETLRILNHDEAYQLAAMKKMCELAGVPDRDPAEFCAYIDEIYDSGYRKWAFDEMAEADEVTLWTKWLLPDFDRELITRNAFDLAFQYRQAKGYRLLVEHGEEVIKELSRRGYTLGIISNLITTWEVPDWLHESGLYRYFKTVVLSAVCGLRKPDPEIYKLAAKNVGIPCEECAYVGDNFNRDVTGSKAAHFGLNIIYTNEKKLQKQMATVSDENRPDGVVFDFLELLDIFPALGEADIDKARPI